MFRKQLLLLLAAMLVLPVSVWGVEVESGQTYCFASQDFSGEKGDLTGICLTQVPEAGGTMYLGDRVLRAGDVLTAEQAAAVVFAAQETQGDAQVEIGFLPVFSGGVAPETTICLSVRGREDKAPIAEDSAMETYKNLVNNGKLKVQDPEGQAMTYTVVRQPRRGSVTVHGDGSFTYEPKKNKVGVDSFTYTAADPAGNVSREATVTITILKPKDMARYTDTVGEECCFAAEWMRNTGIFTGEALAGNPCFSPEKAVTRGEFITMLVKALEIPVEEELTYTGYEEDVPQWLKPYLAAAVRAGLTAELPVGETFGAAEPIKGAEAAALLYAGLDWTSGGEYSGEVPTWAQEVVAEANRQGYALQEELPVTRGEAAQMVYRARQEMLGREMA